jgi:hypothetical protein
MAGACSSSGGDDTGLEPVDDRASSTTESVTSTTSQGTTLSDPTLAAEIPDIDGISFVSASPPHHYDTWLPEQSSLVRRRIDVGGAPQGWLTVVAPPDGMAYEDFEDAVVDGHFAGPVQVEADEEEVEDGIFVVTNEASPQWVTYGDEFVLEAAVDNGTARRAWFWDGLLWIVEGHAASSVVESLAQAQHQIAAPDDYDTFAIAGELNERFPDLPDYTYLDLLRADLITNLPDSMAGSCADQWLPFGVATDPNDSVVDDDNIVVEMAVIGSRCDGFDEDLRAFLMDQSGAHDAPIGATPAIVGDAVEGWTEDGIAFVVSAPSPDTLTRYRPFVDAFAQYQADQPLID